MREAYSEFIAEMREANRRTLRAERRGLAIRFGVHRISGVPTCRGQA